MHNSGNSSPVTDDNGRTYAEQKATQKTRWTKSYKKAKITKLQKQYPQPNANNSWGGSQPTPSNSWGRPGNPPAGAPQYQSVFDNSPQPNNNYVFPTQTPEGKQASQSALIWGTLSAIFVLASAFSLIGFLIVFAFAFSLTGFIFGVIGFRKAKQAQALGCKASVGYWLSLSSIIFGSLSTVLELFGIFVLIHNYV